MLVREGRETGHRQLRHRWPGEEVVLRVQAGARVPEAEGPALHRPRGRGAVHAREGQEQRETGHRQADYGIEGQGRKWCSGCKPAGAVLGAKKLSKKGGSSAGAKKRKRGAPGGRSSGVSNKKRKRRENGRKCSKCGGHGHNCSTCPN